MLYSEIRDELKTGDLLAWRITKITSIFSLILILYQKLFKVRFSHVGIVIKINNRVFLLEATPPVVRLFPLSMIDDFYIIKCNMDESKQDKYINVLFRKLGTKYSISDLIKGIFGIKSSNKSLYCSELAGDFYKEVGFITDEDYGYTPDRLVNKICEITKQEPIPVNIDIGNIVNI